MSHRGQHAGVEAAEWPGMTTRAVYRVDGGVHAVDSAPPAGPHTHPLSARHIGCIGPIER